MTGAPPPRGGPRALAAPGATLVYCAALTAYFVGVTHRTALGVAGVEAIDRFSLSATGLAAFSVVQLTVYAGLQIPAGRLLDRFGARALITVGSLVMALGQLLLAFAHDLPTVLAARVLLGAGDAAIFISAIRLVAQWFPPRRVPILVQVTGLVGQCGQLASAVPVAWILHQHGWTAAFGTLAVVGLAASMFSFACIRTGPLGKAHEGRAPGFVDAVRASTRPAGTRLGWWSHFVAPFSANVVGLLWGVPFFVTAQHRTKAEASALLLALTLTSMVTGPMVGRFTARHPLRRSWAVLASAVATLVAWVLLLAPSTPRPMWQLTAFVIVIGIGAPVALIGMDYARSSSPHHLQGTATGFVNTGGFTSTIGAVLAIGLVLQLASPAGATTYSLDAYRLAFSVLLVPWVLGVVGVLHNRRLARAELLTTGTAVPALRDVWQRRR